MFALSETSISAENLSREMTHLGSGACVTFEGWVRDTNVDRRVRRLDYQAYAALAEAEGKRVIHEAMQQFSIVDARCTHRVGALEIGDLAVWVGVSAAHRDAAFAACRYVIDEIKKRVPIWKNEHYSDGESGWLHPDGTAVDSS
jgi:molybdopterin synthase catalytic subunit